MLLGFRQTPRQPACAAFERWSAWLSLPQPGPSSNHGTQTLSTHSSQRLSASFAEARPIFDPGSAGTGPSCLRDRCGRPSTSGKFIQGKTYRLRSTATRSQAVLRLLCANVLKGCVLDPHTPVAGSAAKPSLLTLNLFHQGIGHGSGLNTVDAQGAEEIPSRASTRSAARLGPPKRHFLRMRFWSDTTRTFH